MKKARLAILASGSGTNAESIMFWAKNSDCAEVVCLGSNKKEAKVLERARKFSVPCFVHLKKNKSELRESYDLRLVEKLKAFKPDWIILAGYMRILSADFIKSFDGKIINIHPSLLPDFPGTDGYGDAYN